MMDSASVFLELQAVPATSASLVILDFQTQDVQVYHRSIAARALQSDMSHSWSVNAVETVRGS